MRKHGYIRALGRLGIAALLACTVAISPNAVAADEPPVDQLAMEPAVAAVEAESVVEEPVVVAEEPVVEDEEPAAVDAEPVAEEVTAPEKPEVDVVAPAPKPLMVEPMAAGPDGATPPYVHWRVVDTNGNLVLGSTFRLERRVSQSSWGGTVTVADCTAAGCSGVDRDADPGEFLAKWIGSNNPGVNPGGTTVTEGGRYRIRPSTAPPGYRWVSSTSWSETTGSGWSGETYDFGEFEVQRNTYDITVRIGSYRTGTGVDHVSAGHTAGARLGLFADQGSTEPDWTCVVETSDLGNCVFVDVAVDSNVNYYVKHLPPVPGSEAELNLGNRIPAFSTGEYFLRTGTLTSSSHGSITLPGVTSNSTSGYFATRAVNPKLIQSCSAGVKVAVVLDTSGSVAGYQNQLAGATTALVDGLAGTPSSVALFSFARNSPGGIINQPSPSSVETTAGANIVKRWYSSANGNANFSPTGGTNWDMGLYQAALGAQQHDYDIVFVLTDGNPTYSNSPVVGPGSATYLRELERAVFSANAVKQTGARIITVGIGGNLSDDNLAAVSGPSKYSQGDSLNDFDYITADWQQLERVLENFAQGLNCEATITVEKQAKPHGGTYAPASGWDFDIHQSGAAELKPVSSRQTTAADGTAAWTLTFDRPTDEAVVDLTEFTDRARWELANVTCDVQGTTVDLALGTVKIPGVGVGENIKCTFWNEQSPPEVTLTVQKTWTINGGTPVPHGQQPEGLEAGLQVDPAGVPSQPVDWGQELSGFVLGESVTISEVTEIDDALLPGCRLTSSTMRGDGIDGDRALGAGITVQLPNLSNSFEVTNDVTCQTLTLTKEVVNSFGGTLSGDDWDGGLFAADAATTLTFDSGETKHVPAGEYVLSESDVPGYRLDNLVCEGGHLDGRSLAVAAGETVSCIFTNVDLPGSVSWTKVGADGAERLGGSEWLLTGPTGVELPVADCVGDSEAACADSADRDPQAGEFRLEGLSWGDYALAETWAPAGYVLDETERLFSISAAELNHRFTEPFVNEQRDGPVLPLTGGISRDFFLILGLSTLILGLGAAAVARRNRLKGVADL